MLRDLQRIGALMCVAALVGFATGGCAPSAVAAQPISPAQPAAWAEPAKSLLPLEERLERLRSLFGPGVEIGPPADRQAGVVPARARLDFDDPAELTGFGVISNQWLVSGGRLYGQGIGVSRIVYLLPLESGGCRVSGSFRSSHFLELGLVDPAIERYDGSRAVGLLHFGKMEHHSSTDWMELASKEQSLERIWDIRFDDGLQEGALSLDAGQLRATLTTTDKPRTMEGQTRHRDVSPAVMVMMAGAVNNKVEIDSLTITGSIDLDSERTAILTGMGPEFWGKGREVMLHYRARGSFRRLLLNGTVVAKHEADPEVWWPTKGPLRRTKLTLRYGDVVAFELAGVDDEGALHLVGVDAASGRAVMATHPLRFGASTTKPDDTWYAVFDDEKHVRPYLSMAQDGSVMRRMRTLLKRDFPGLPITGPPVGRERRVYLKTPVR